MLKDDFLNSTVGGKILFTTTLTPDEQMFLVVIWSFDDKSIITFNGDNTTVPEYEDRITFFISTASLELRNLTLNDSGVYKVIIAPAPPEVRLKEGHTTLRVFGERFQRHGVSQCFSVHGSRFGKI